MYVLEFYRRHQGLLAYKLFTHIERARTEMIAMAHEQNARTITPEGLEARPFWTEGRNAKGKVEHVTADHVQIWFDDPQDDGHGYRFHWMNEFRIIEVPVDTPHQDKAEWPSYRR